MKYKSSLALATVEAYTPLVFLPVVHSSCAVSLISSELRAILRPGQLLARVLADVGKIIFAAIVVGRFVSVLCILWAVLLVKERAK